jgi:hypothetical protein
MVTWDKVSPAEVERALAEYDRLGPEAFFAAHGFSFATTYELIWDERRYPPKAILGTAYDSLPASAWSPVTSKAGRAAPSRCSDGWGSASGPSGRLSRPAPH